MKVMVGSVYSDDARSSRWYKLQMKWLKRTSEFEHVVFRNCDLEFSGSIVLPERGFAESQEGHIEGLNSLIEYFKTTEYQYFLLLDSDSFPVCPKWLPKLVDAMENFEIAAPIRFENLDSFAHPCSFFFKRSAIDKIKFGLNDLRNLRGHEHKEVSTTIEKFFPLIRTNRLNKHPLIAGIYWNIFYHHAAGSRDPIFRAFEQNYYPANFPSIENQLYDELMNDSEGFISQLMNKDPLGSDTSIPRLLL